MKIAIIGAGAMGGAMARGLIEASFCTPDELTVSNPHHDKLEPLQQIGVNVTLSNKEAARGAELVVMAVKHWILPDVASEISDSLSETKEVAAIVAGISGEKLSEMFPGNYNLTIAMPNTAMSLRKSMTFLVGVRGKAELSSEAFRPLGYCDVIPERLLPAGMALASCGIAFALRYVRAACEGGVELGFRASEAQRIVAATLEGAAELMKNPEAHPEREIDKVTTPGGITIRGLNAMERFGFTTSVIEGLKASAE